MHRERAAASECLHDGQARQRSHAQSRLRVRLRLGSTGPLSLHDEKAMNECTASQRRTDGCLSTVHFEKDRDYHGVIQLVWLQSVGAYRSMRQTDTRVNVLHKEHAHMLEDLLWYLE